MAGVGLKEDLIEMEGLDLGANKARRPYYDSATTPASLHHFDHTQDGSVHPTHDHQHVPVAPAHRGPDQPGHPDHAMLEQIRAGVRSIDEGLGKPHDAMSERVSRSLLAACKGHRATPGTARAANALGRVDHVVLGTTGNIFAVEGRLDDPAHKRAAVRVEDAIRTPVEQSDERLQAASQAIEREQSRARQPMHDIDDAIRAGPAMSM
jgi:hypothetical protein